MKLLHFHLPKTGGTALRGYFAEQLGESAVTPALQGMLSEALLWWQHATVISGHFIARQGDRIPQDRVAITVLRRPVDRFLSEYQYNKFDIDNLLVNAIQRSGDLDAYLEQMKHAPATASLTQIEMLYPLGTDAQRRLTTEEKVAASIKAIDGFALAGIQEEMEDFCSMLCAKFQWPLIQSKRINVTSRRLLADDLPERQRRAIEKALEPEMILYNYARSRFAQDRRRFISLSTPSIELQNAVDDDKKTSPPKTRQDFGDLRCEINSIEIVGRVSGPGQVMTGETVDIFLNITANEPLDKVNAGIAIRDELGSLIFGTNSQLLGDAYSLSPGKYIFKFAIFNRMSPGSYSVDAALTPTESHYDGCFHWRPDAAQFNVIAYATQHFEGRVLLDVNVSVESVSQNAEWHRNAVRPSNLMARAFGNMTEPLTHFDCSIELMSVVDNIQHDSDVLLQVKLTNRGAEAWPNGGRHPVKLSYRWFTPEGHMVVADGVRSDLPDNLQPGCSVVTFMQVRAPSSPGKFCIAASPVQEYVAWFIDKSAANGFVVPVTVL